MSVAFRPNLCPTCERYIKQAWHTFPCDKCRRTGKHHYHLSPFERNCLGVPECRVIDIIHRINKDKPTKDTCSWYCYCGARLLEVPYRDEDEDEEVESSSDTGQKPEGA